MGPFSSTGPDRGCHDARDGPKGFVRFSASEPGPLRAPSGGLVPFKRDPLPGSMLSVGRVRSKLFGWFRFLEPSLKVHSSLFVFGFVRNHVLVPGNEPTNSCVFPARCHCARKYKV